MGTESRMREPRIAEATRRAARIRAEVVPAAQGAAGAAKGPARRPPQGQGRARARAAPRSDQNRLAELKAKLGDEDYMNGAILRIATVLSARLTLR
jgi:hypothetical protein